MNAEPTGSGSTSLSLGLHGRTEPSAAPVLTVSPWGGDRCGSTGRPSEIMLKPDKKIKVMIKVEKGT